MHRVYKLFQIVRTKMAAIFDYTIITKIDRILPLLVINRYISAVSVHYSLRKAMINTKVTCN